MFLGLMSPVVWLKLPLIARFVLNCTYTSASGQKQKRRWKSKWILTVNGDSSCHTPNQTVNETQHTLSNYYSIDRINEKPSL